MIELLNYFKVCYLEEKGQGIVEYALILAFVVGIATYLTTGDSTLKTAVEGAFGRVVTQLNL